MIKGRLSYKHHTIKLTSQQTLLVRWFPQWTWLVWCEGFDPWRSQSAAKRRHSQSTADWLCMKTFT